MDEKEAFDRIDPSTFDTILEEYRNIVPEKLFELDNQRYNIIPEALTQQTALSKDQIATLVDWKLSHGKFRPSLKAYVQQNADSFCKEQTTDAFKTVAGASKDAKKIQEALKILTKLKGIGPATASLLLSCFEPAVVPFFSDELFRWSVFEDSKARGWGREIKYTMKEYLQLFDKVQEFITRLVVEYSQQISVVEIEKVAYVLGKRAAGGAPSAAGNKRKAETEPKDELRGDLSTSAQSVPLPTKASDGVKMKKAEEKQTERPKAEGVEPEPSTRAKRAKTKKKTTTDVTAAASRPRCNAS